jgi:GT2 family glycosyltransferase
MLLTVLTPTYNCAQTLSDTLASVVSLASRLPGRIQHLAGDAGSYDGTWELLAAHISRNEWASARCLPGCNIPVTLNALLEQAVGCWVMVLNGDDYFEVNALTDLLENADQSDRPMILCGEVSVLSPEGYPIGVRRCRLDLLNRFMSINHPAMVVKRSVFDKAGMFDLRYPSNYDYVWTWRVFRAGIPLKVYPHILAHVRGGGISTQSAHEAAKEILAVKIAAGCILPALRDYAAHRFKAAMRVLLPAEVTRWLSLRYRGFKGSIDQY